METGRWETEDRQFGSDTDLRSKIKNRFYLLLAAICLLLPFPATAQIVVQGNLKLQGKVALGGAGFSLSSSVNPSTFGSPLTFMASVSPSSASGTVTF